MKLTNSAGEVYDLTPAEKKMLTKEQYAELKAHGFITVFDDITVERGKDGWYVFITKYSDSGSDDECYNPDRGEHLHTALAMAGDLYEAQSLYR